MGGIGTKGRGDRVHSGAPSGLRAKSAQMFGRLSDTANHTLTVLHAVLAHKSVYDFDVRPQ
jgi:hypothetical protein